MKKKIALIVLTGLLFIFSLVEYISSFGYSDYDGYRDVTFSTDALIVLISSAILVVLAVMLLVGHLKNKSYTKEIKITCLAVTGFHSAYSLFTMIKIIGKAVGKLWDHKEFKLSYADVSSYIVWFLLATALLVYLIFDFLEFWKSKKQ